MDGAFYSRAICSTRRQTACTLSPDRALSSGSHALLVNCNTFSKSLESTLLGAYLYVQDKRYTAGASHHAYPNEDIVIAKDREQQRWDGYKMHFLIPATDVNINLCKTLLTAGILGYPSPSILAWQEPYDEQGGLGGGSHLLKISRTLEYLNSLGPAQDEELVFMIDAYDIQFQLPVEVLINRFFKVNEAANDRLQNALGAAYQKERIRQTIVFGAGKRCAPNALWEVACYTVPMSPAPADTYNNNTDTVLGHNQWYSVRQRYINSGYIIGPVKEMRKLFVRAQEWVDAHKEHPIYGASDQAIFALIMGEQNYVREQKRLQHVSILDKLFRTRLAKPIDNNIHGLYIDNILHPSTTHTAFDPKPGVDYEFGIGLDYESDLGHQTMNSDIGRDSQWIQYTTEEWSSMQEQVNEKFNRHGKLDCKLNVPALPASDVMSSARPFHLLEGNSDAVSESSWNTIPLYTHLCFGTQPVMIHHNGGKERREQTWTQLWFQSRARDLLVAQMETRGSARDIHRWEDFKKDPGVKQAGGAWTDRGEWVPWWQMCPDSTYGGELYRNQ